MENIKKYKLDTLCDLFGNHYGTGFFQMQTPIEDITAILVIVEDGFLSPYEIDMKIRKELLNKN